MRIWFHLHDLLSFLLDCCCVQVFIEILSFKRFYICTSQMWIEMCVKSPKLQQVPHVCDLNFRLWGFVLFCLKVFGILSVYHIKLDSDQCGLFCSGLNTNVGHQKEKKKSQNPSSRILFSSMNPEFDPFLLWFSVFCPFDLMSVRLSASLENYRQTVLFL